MKDELDQGYNIDQLSQIFHVSRSKLFLDFKQPSMWIHRSFPIIA